MRFRAFALSATMFLALGGCSLAEANKQAQAAVTKFHGQLDAGQLEQIWDGSSRDMKSASQKADLIKLLQAVERKLGRFQSGTQTGWRENTTMAGRFSEVAMDSVYEKGKAQEDFVFRHQDGQLQLSGYHINSNTMMEN